MVDLVEALIIKIQQIFARSVLTFLAFVGCIFIATILAQMAYTPPGMYRTAIDLTSVKTFEVSQSATTMGAAGLNQQS